MRIARIACILLAVPVFAAPLAVARIAPDTTHACQIGMYRLADGSDVDIAPTDEQSLRWRRKDGTTGALQQDSDGKWTSTLGWTGKPDGIGVSFKCSKNEIIFDGTHGKRAEFDVIDTRFKVEGATLAGRLVLPKGNARVPIVVLVHGAEHSSARDFYALQRLFPSEGIGAFVYDKRGTGASDGLYTQDYLILAVDAIAALEEAKRLGGKRARTVGYQAGSQGGWVAPLAAIIEPVDFVIVGFGLAVSPLEEDRSAIVLDMTRRGYGPEIVAKAMEVADATAAIATSGFREGYGKLDAVRRKYKDEPWFKYVRGNITFLFLAKSPDELRELGPKLFAGAPVNYDPMPVLHNLKVRQLWILGEDDIDAPSAETTRRLHHLARDGSPITTVVFPGAEHGLYEYETTADGKRLSTRQPEGYFRMMRDFILEGRLKAGYGHAKIFPAKSSSAVNAR